VVEQVRRKGDDGWGVPDTFDRQILSGRMQIVGVPLRPMGRPYLTDLPAVELVLAALYRTKAAA